MINDFGKVKLNFISDPIAYFQVIVRDRKPVNNNPYEQIIKDNNNTISDNSRPSGIDDLVIKMLPVIPNPHGNGFVFVDDGMGPDILKVVGTSPDSTETLPLETYTFREVLEAAQEFGARRAEATQQERVYVEIYTEIPIDYNQGHTPLTVEGLITLKARDTPFKLPGKYGLGDFQKGGSLLDPGTSKSISTLGEIRLPHYRKGPPKGPKK